jgi:hypothetical protein
MKEAIIGWLCVALLASAPGCRTQGASYVEPEKQPAVVLTLVVAGFGGPIDHNYVRFALYDTGLVIVQRTSEDRLDHLYSVKLSKDEMKAWLATLPLEDFRRLERYYTIASGTDENENQLTFFDAATGATHVTFVIGFLPNGDPRPVTGAARTPDAFLKIYQALNSYSHPRERPWFPDFVVVYAQVDHTKSIVQEQCVWPTDWERFPASASTHAAADSMQFNVIGTRLPAIERLLKDCRHGVFLDGQPTSMGVQVHFPNLVVSL